MQLQHRAVGADIVNSRDFYPVGDQSANDTVLPSGDRVFPLPLNLQGEIRGETVTPSAHTHRGVVRLVFYPTLRQAWPQV